MLQSDYTPSYDQCKDLAVQLATKYPSLKARCNGRFEQAAVIASTPGTISQAEDTPVLYVKSQRDDTLTYTVEGKACTCPDHLSHSSKGVICKHRLATHLFSKAIELHSILSLIDEDRLHYKHGQDEQETRWQEYLDWIDTDPRNQDPLAAAPGQDWYTQLDAIYHACLSGQANVHHRWTVLCQDYQTYNDIISSL